MIFITKFNYQRINIVINIIILIWEPFHRTWTIWRTTLFGMCVSLLTDFRESAAMRLKSQKWYLYKQYIQWLILYLASVESFDDLRWLMKEWISVSVFCSRYLLFTNSSVKGAEPDHIWVKQTRFKEHASVWK